LINNEGELIKKNEAEMNYMLFSKEGKKFPFKLSKTVTRKDLSSLGFEDVGIVNLEKGQDGLFHPIVNPDMKKKINDNFQETVGRDFFVDKDTEKLEKTSPSSVKRISKEHLSEENLAFQAHLQKLTEAVTSGEVMDHEDYYHLMDEIPQLRAIKAKKDKQKLAVLQKSLAEAKEISRLQKNIDKAEEEQREKFQRNKTKIREGEVESAIDTLMKDEWSRVRVAQVSFNSQCKIPNKIIGIG